MSRTDVSPLLEEIASPTSLAAQIAALRKLKNEIIGYKEKKQTWVQCGVIEPIARILSTHTNSPSKSADRSYDGQHSKEQEVLRQATIIVSSLARGGPAYLPPLLSGPVLSPLLGLLDPNESEPQVVLAALRALNSIADSLLLEQPYAESVEGNFLQVLYTEQNIKNLVTILYQQSTALAVQQQVSLAAALVCKTCHSESQRILLAEGGILEALALKIISFVVESTWTDPCLVYNSPNPICPATSKSRLAPILQAVGMVTSKSDERVRDFVLASPFWVLFYNEPEEDSDAPTPGHPPQASPDHAQEEPHSHFLAPLYASQSISGPQVLRSNGRTRSFNFGEPIRPYKRLRTDLYPKNFPHDAETGETPLVSYLIQVVRSSAGMTRLMAAWVLIILFRSGYARLVPETYGPGFALLIIPLLVSMLDDDPGILRDAPPSYDDSALQREDWIILEKAPMVLALIVEENVPFQQVAVDSGVIKRLSQLLKKSYNPLPATPPNFVSTQHEDAKMSGTSETAKKPLDLAVHGLSAQAVHVLRMRETALIALAALATQQDEFRKAIIENGVVPFVVDSLKPFTQATGKEGEGQEISLNVIGNPTAVLLAACGTARALSRSVNTLRTSLVDASLAKPLFMLLRHPDIQVQIATAAVICNLLLEFSPMREPLIEAGVLDILCDHAHSMDVRLRLNAIWGLKHLVNRSPNSLKMKCLEDLGPGWLKQIISSDCEPPMPTTSFKREREFSSGVPNGMSTPNAAGEQVNLLNAIDDRQTASEGEDDSGDDEDMEEVAMIDSIGALSKTSPHASSSSTPNSRANSSTKPSHSASLNPSVHASLSQVANGEIAVQEQALSLIQNLICGDNASEMLDHLFSEFGMEDVFEILIARVSPRSNPHSSTHRNRYGASSRHSSSSSKRPASAHQVPYISSPLRPIDPSTAPSPEIIKAVMYIIVHIAACGPRHRQTLMAQTSLLPLIIPFFSHQDKEIRRQCAWLVINLTFCDDQQERSFCRSRALEMRRLGVMAKLEELGKDPDLDVKERTKTAVEQMAALLRGI